MELHGGRQACNLLVILAHDICNNSVFAWWNLLREIYVLGELEVALLERAFEVDILNGVAEVGLLVDDPNKTILDLE